MGLLLHGMCGVRMLQSELGTMEDMYRWSDITKLDQVGFYETGRLIDTDGFCRGDLDLCWRRYND